MTADATATPLGPKALGLLGAILAKATPAEVKDLLAEAGIGKASEKIDAEHMNAGQVDDLWDGGPDQMPKLQRISRGASGNQAGGTIQIGKPQAASGDGATRMEATYSPDMAAQSGVTEVTTRLGEMLNGLRAQMKSVVEVAKAHDMQLSVIGAALTNFIERQETLSKAVADLHPIPKPVLAKGETDETEKDRKEADDEEMEKAFGDETEDKDDKDEKAAAKSRVLAKAQVKAARQAASAARKAQKAGDAALVKAERANLRSAIAKAQAHFDLAKVLNPEALGLAAVRNEMEALEKALPKADAENQDIWPCSKAEKKEEDEKPFGDEAGKAQIDAAAFAKAADKLAAALNGTALLSADLRSVMAAVGGQSRSDAGLPPVFELMKSDPSKVVSIKKAEIKKAYGEGKLTRGEVDLASDMLGHMEAAARGQSDPTVAQARLRSAPPAVRVLFEQVAA
jgi:hypothetical protein